jgi:hypothetical protein
MAIGSSAKPTQDFVPIKEIRDGVVILNDGSMRAIVMVSSVNFALKSADEQNSIIFQFQNFLNSLDFTVQLFIQSRKLDVKPYLALLEDRYRAQLSDLMRVQIREYIRFVQSFTDTANIMSKSFFAVIPYSPPAIGGGSGAGIFGAKKTGAEATAAKNVAFEEYRSQLEQRVGVVSQGMSRCGIRAIELGTEEVVELFYKIFNPGDTEKPIQLT